MSEIYNLPEIGVFIVSLNYTQELCGLLQL